MMTGRKPISSWRCVLGLTALLALSTAVVPEHAVLGDYLPQKCFGETPYNCYSAGDIDPKILDTKYADINYAYANFAWQDFLALNFPAAYDSNGDLTTGPSTTNGLDFSDGAYTTVWETYAEARDLFLPKGMPPPAFGSGHEVPDVCTKATKEGGDKNVRLARQSNLEDRNNKRT